LALAALRSLAHSAITGFRKPVITNSRLGRSSSERDERRVLCKRSSG
jgi:hypothetical protein